MDLAKIGDKYDVMIENGRLVFVRKEIKQDKDNGGVDE